MSFFDVPYISDKSICIISLLKSAEMQYTNGMLASTEILLNQFLRTYPNEFSAKELVKWLANCGITVSLSECINLLESNSYVFPLERKKYITRAGVFSDGIFSFKPTPFELQNGVFAVGHRCMPFVDFDVVSCSLQFYFGSKRLTTKVIEFDSDAALDLFSLYGMEYTTQYICSDPANKDFNLAAHDFQLPSKIKLTCFSLKPVLDSCDFHYGDRILCRLLDWDNGKIEIVPRLTKSDGDIAQMKTSDMIRQNWYQILEDALLESFSIVGPCASIEEQLSNVFFMNYNKLCIADCGSVEEYLQYAHKVAVENFGVETRFWYKGKDVPAVGFWNNAGPVYHSGRYRAEFNLPEYIVDSYLKDYMYQKKTNIKELVDTIFPKAFVMTPEEKKCFLLHIMNRNVILLKSYNWFADFVTGAIRHRALKLYSRISTLVYDIDSTGKNLDKFPQQELVILSQLFGHLSRILESIEREASYVIQDSDSIMLSLEGMEYNFDEIKDELIAAVAELHKNDFTII